MKKGLLIVALLLAVADIQMVGAKGYRIFSNGKSSYDIVLPAQASASEKTAARELRKFMKLIGNVELPITDGTAAKGKHIYVGFSEQVGKLTGMKRPEYKDEAFTVRNVGANLIIFGGAKRGTLYGVYGFLQKELGCRWWTPSDSLVPQRKEWQMPSNLYYTEKPAVSIRFNQYHDAMNRMWAVRQFNNAVEQTDEYGGCEGYWNGHTTGQFVTPQEFFEKHPEYFALRDGKRIENGQLCLSNPEVLKLCTERLRQSMKKWPQYAIYSLSQNDNSAYCQCEKCNALAKKYGGQSGLLLWFVNQAADALKDEFPDKYVGTFAYMYTRKPPVGIKPRENVVIRLCDIECCFVHSLETCASEQNKNFIQDLKAWSDLAPHLFIWDYVVTYTQYMGPFPNFKVLAPNMKTFIRNKAIGIQEEAQYQTTCSEFSELRGYVISKLLWNPDLNLDSLVNEFLNGYYGKAAPKVREYYDLLESQVTPDVHLDIFPQAKHPIFTDAFAQKGRLILEEAKRMAAPKNAHKVERLLTGPLYLQTMRHPKEAIQDGTFEEVRRIVRRDGGRYSELPEGNVDQWEKRVMENK